MIKIRPTILAILFLCSFESAFADSCPLEKSIDLTMDLSTLSKELELKAYTSGSSDLKQADGLLIKINALESSPDPDIVGTVDKLAKDISDKALVPMKQAMASAEKAIGNNLKGDDDISELIRKAYNSGLKLLNPSETGGGGSLLTTAKNKVASMKAYPKYVEENNKMIRDLLSKLTEKCMPSESAFDATIDGKKVSFSKCAQVAAFEPESEMWGGKIAPGNCRHIVSCASVKSEDAAPPGAGYWVLDCKKQSDSCPEVTKCASQVQAGEGTINKSKPAGGVR